jgi:hypothetical protein
MLIAEQDDQLFDIFRRETTLRPSTGDGNVFPVESL